MEFTIELLDQEKSIVFLDMKIKRRSDGCLETEWYRKPSNTDTLLNYRSCAPISFKKNLIQGTVHRIFNATSTWPAFDEALSICNDLWRKNQYPEEFTDQIVLPTIEKCMGRGSNSERKETRRYAGEEGNSDKSRGESNLTSNNESEERAKYPFVIPYRSRISDQFIAKLKELIPV